MDNIKNEWARTHGYILYRVWESDIHKHKNKVIKELKEILNIDTIKENKKKRH